MNLLEIQRMCIDFFKREREKEGFAYFPILSHEFSQTIKCFLFNLFVVVVALKNSFVI